MTEETLFTEAMELPPEARAAFLDQNCGEDAELRERVEILLRSHDEPGSFLEKSAEEDFDATLDISVDDQALIAARTAELRKSQAKKLPTEKKTDDHEPPSVNVIVESGGKRVTYFGDYELKGEIARGAMGVVYRGEQESLKRTVAIKMIRSTMLTNEVDVSRFKAEAEAAASLDHPNIVPIYEVGMHEEQHYFTMKLIEGGTLRGQIERLQKDPRAAAKMMSTVAGAIHTAHQRSILHRDLKPGNILVDEDGEPHVTDFGLAKQMESNSSVTLSGQIMGTPQYMAPEQAEGGGKELTTAADVYALGAIFYEMLCGQPPHVGTSLMETLKLVAEEEAAPPSKHNPKVDRDLETIAMKCLEKDPAKRYASAQGLKNDLDRWLRGEPIEARPVGTAEKIIKWMKRKPMHAAAALLGVLFLLTLGVGGPIVGYRQNRLLVQIKQAEADYRLELAQSLERTTAGGVPFLIDALGRNSTPGLLRLLKDRLASTAELKARIRIATALAVMDEPDWSLLIQYIADLPSEEGPNLGLAFAAHPEEALVRLRARFDAAKLKRERNRLAILILGLGDPGPAAQQLALGPTIENRTDLIHEFKEWHSEPGKITETLKNAEDPGLRSGLCLAVGGVTPDSFSPEQLTHLLDVLNTHYVEAIDSGTHAGAEWAIRQLGGEPAEIAPKVHPEENRDWYVNRSGFTMVRISPGLFFPSDYAREEQGKLIPDNHVGLTEDYFLSWATVTASQFEEIFRKGRELGVPETEKMPPFRDKFRPLACVPWINAVVFCNAVSAIEGLKPVYTVNFSKVDIDFQADGYRLPSEAEWELAARAGTETRYISGPTSEHLTDYAHIFGEFASVGRNSRPNPNGLFDMTGNAWEMTLDSGYTRSAGWSLNPVGPVGNKFAMRGGAVEGGVFYYHGSVKHVGATIEGGDRWSFRIARGIPGAYSNDPTSEELKALLAGKLTRNQQVGLANQLAKEQAWEEASTIWNRLILEHPKQDEFEIEAGQISARWANWELAGGYLFEAAKRRSTISSLYVDASVAYLEAGNLDGYLQVRDHVLSLGFDQEDLYQLARAFRIALLRPPYEDLGSKLRVDAFAGNLGIPNKDLRKSMKLTNAWIALRLKDTDTTLARLEEIGDGVSLSLETKVWSVKAMALLEKGEVDHARELISRAGERIDSHLKPPHVGRWQDWLIANQLRQEAEEKLKEKERQVDSGEPKDK